MAYVTYFSMVMIYDRKFYIVASLPATIIIPFILHLAFGVIFMLKCKNAVQLLEDVFSDPCFRDTLQWLAPSLHLCYLSSATYDGFKGESTTCTSSCSSCVVSDSSNHASWVLPTLELHVALCSGSKWTDLTKFTEIVRTCLYYSYIVLFYWFWSQYM